MSEQELTKSLLPLHYEGHEIRAYVDELGMVWWVAQDVGTILAVQNVRQNLAEFPRDEVGVCTIYTNAGTRETLTVSEPGLYRLVFQSRKAEAEALKRWVFHDVLPTLRRTGRYTIPEQEVGFSPNLSKPIAPSNHLPPRTRPAQEMAHVSEMLLAVWVTLRQAEDPITNTEIAHTTRVPLRTVQRHTKYLLQLGVIDLYETRPSHLFMVAEQADKRAAGHFQRLERIAAIMEQRQRRLFA